MQNNSSSIGPRGWAILTLVGGAALASLFLRPPQEPSTEGQDDSSFASSQLPGRLASAQVIRDRSIPQPLDVAELNIPLDAGPTMPSAKNGLLEPQLPAWASPPSPLDQLISQGTAPAWQQPAQTPSLEPLAAWQSGSPAHSVPTALPRHNAAENSRGDRSLAVPLGESQHEVSVRLPPPWPVTQPWPAVARPSAGSTEGPTRVSQPQPSNPLARSPGSLVAAPGNEAQAISLNAPGPARSFMNAPQLSSSVEAKQFAGGHSTAPSMPAEQPVRKPKQFVFQPGYQQP